MGATPPLRRARVMFKFKELLDLHADALAAIITSEARQGPLRCEGRSHPRRRSRRVRVRHSASAEGEYTEQVGTGVDSYSVRQPLGVCAVSLRSISR